MTRNEAREIAFKSVFAYINNTENFDIAKTIEISKKDKDLDVESHQFVYSVITSLIDNFDSLQQMIDSHSGEFVYSRIYKVDLALLYLALTEILYIQTPVKVAINETINLAKLFSTPDSPKYINGVLANIVKDMDK